MKKMLSLAALGMAALGTTLWAQQDEEPPPARASDAASSVGTDELIIRAEELRNAASAGALPPLSTAPNGTQPARSNSARSSGLGNRSTGTGRSFGGPAGPARADLDMLPNSGPTPYPAYGSLPQFPPMQFGTNDANYRVPRYSNNGQVVYSPDGKQFAYIGPDGRQRTMTDEEMQSAQEFRQTVEALRKAKTDEEKTDIRAKLNDLVGKQIDQDLAEREKRLTELEAKAKLLRDQLQQRKQSKVDIQKMLVMLIENPQGGLGLPPAWMDAINPSVYQPQDYLTPTIPSAQSFYPQTVPYPSNNREAR